MEVGWTMLKQYVDLLLGVDPPAVIGAGGSCCSAQVPRAFTRWKESVLSATKT